jgi:hypothetical protein
MTAVHCHQCGRPNGASVKKCIWCNAQISDGASSGTFDTTTVEADYLEGIDRLIDPAPVRLVISPNGIEVVELLPGSRSIKIPAGSIIEANLAHSPADKRPTERRWWRNVIEPLRLASAPVEKKGVVARDYVLTIKYTDGDEVRTGVFTRSDQPGLELERKLARVLAKLTEAPRHSGGV